MTKEDAANTLIAMYSSYAKYYGHSSEKNAAVTIAVAALAESAGKDACAECREERSQLSALLDEVKAIRLSLETGK